MSVRLANEIRITSNWTSDLMIQPLIFLLYFVLQYTSCCILFGHAYIKTQCWERILKGSRSTRAKSIFWGIYKCCVLYNHHIYYQYYNLNKITRKNCGKRSKQICIINMKVHTRTTRKLSNSNWNKKISRTLSIMIIVVIFCFYLSCFVNT